MPAKAVVAARQPLKPWLICVALVCLGISAYCNSFWGPFIFDDVAAIRANPDFGSKLDIRFSSTPLTARPMLWLSFAMDYALAGQNVEAYHATNLLIHLAAGMLLFGIVRRNLLRKQTWGNRFQTSGIWLAGAVAALWMVHPLTTAAVTYIVQRSESQAAFFYLLVIYCLIRSAESNPRGALAWSCGGIVACALGALTKETLVSAPLVALIYDRTFLAGSFAEALRIRRWLYVGLAASWGILAVLTIQGHGRGETVGIHLGISATQYARTQLGVIAHYVLLAFWPRGLVLAASDWPIARHWNQIGVPGVLIAMLMVVSLIALYRWPRPGFLLVSIFLILAPTSSVIPIITEIESDQRMYLPLAALVALVVMGGWTLAQRWRLSWCMIVLGPVIIAVLTTLTILRNNDYQTALGIWADAIEKRPNDWTAHGGYGEVLEDIAASYAPGSVQQKAAAGWAVLELQRALALCPHKYLSASQMLSVALAQAGDDQESERFDTQLISQYPERFVEMHRRRGSHRLNRGDLAGARADYEAIIAASPNDVDAHFILGVILEKQKDFSGARAQYLRVIQLSPRYRDVERRLRSLDMGG